VARKDEYVIDKGERFRPFTYRWLERFLKMPEIPGKVFVLAYFRADIEGTWVFGTVKKVAEEVGFSEHGTRDAMHYLEKKNEIRLSMKPGRGDGKLQIKRWPLKKKGDREQTELPLGKSDSRGGPRPRKGNRQSDDHFEKGAKTDGSGISSPEGQAAAQSRNSQSNSQCTDGSTAISESRAKTGVSTEVQPPRGPETQAGTGAANSQSGKGPVKGVTILEPGTSAGGFSGDPGTDLDLIDVDKTCTLSIDKVRALCPSGSAPTLKFFFGETGRSSLTLREVIEFRSLWQDHWPSVIQEKIDKACERFRKKGRPLGDVTVTYVRNMLKGFKTKPGRKGERRDGGDRQVRPRRQLPKFKPRDRSPEVPSVQR
jgi:hypothetical protein